MTVTMAGTPTSSRRRDTPPTVRTHARRAVLEAAAKLLAQDAQASIDEIALASGVGRATLYRWFATRGQLVEAILDQILAEANEIARAALAERTIAPLAVLQSMAREFLALGERYRFMEAKLEHDGEDEQLRVQFVAFIAGAQESGKLRGDLPAEWIASAFAGIVLAACKDVHAQRLTRLGAEELTDRTLAMLLGCPAA